MWGHWPVFIFTHMHILNLLVSKRGLTLCLQALQAAVQRIHTYVTTLEDKVDKMDKKKK